MFKQIFMMMMAFALSTTINLADIESGSDIYAKGEDYIQSESLTIADNGSETVITEFPYSLKDLEEKEYQLKSGENTYTLHVDNTAPTLNITGINGTVFNRDINYSVTSDSEDVTVMLDGNNAQKEGVVTSEGEHVIIAKAKDKAGNETSLQKNFTIDKTSPVITCSAENGTYKTLNVKVNIEGATTQSIALNGKEMSSQFEITETGDYRLLVVATDDAGNTSNLERNFKIRNSAPVIKISGCEKPVQNDDYTIIVTTESDLAVETYITLDGNPIESPLAIIEEGEHVLYVRAVDELGNESTETRHLKIDRSVPVITIEGIDKVSYNTDVNYKITGATKITLNGQNIASEGTISNEGKYVLVATTTNEAGTTTTEKREFRIKKSAPSINVTGLDKDYYNSDVNYSVSTDEGEITVRINNEPVDKTGVIKEEGLYLITVDVVDEAGNTSNYTKEFVIDKTPPVVDITGVTNGYYNKDVTFDATSTDDIVITLDGKEIKPGTISTEGGHVLIARSEDKAGNVTTKSVTFTIDKTAPTIEITGVKEGYYNEDVTYGIKCSDDYELTLNGNKAYPGRVSKEGKYNIHVTSTDLAGNKNEKSLWFVIDKTDPEIQIKGVHNGYFNSDITYTVTSTDDFSVMLDGKETTPGTVTKEGDHTLVVNSKDLAGNTSSKTIDFTIDKTAPVVSFNNVKYTTDLRKIDAKAEDIHLTSFSMTAKCKDKSFTNSTTDSKLKLEQDDNGNAANDKWLFTITAIDKAGNKTVQKKEITRDTVAPEISFDKIKSHVNKDTNVVSHINDPNELKSSMTITRGSDSQTISGKGKLSKIVSHEGTYNVVTTSEDRAGNKSSKSMSFIMDKTKPRVSLHTSSGHVKSADTARVQSNENGPTYLKVVLDGKTVFNGRAASYSSFGTNGIYKVSAYSIDLAGNKSDVVTKEFTVDSKAPVISLTGASEGKYYNKPVTLTASVDERFYDTTTVKITGNVEKSGGISFPFTCSGESTKISKTFSQNGIYHIKMSAQDKAGNSATTKELSFIIDTKDPEVTIEVPDQGGFDAIIAPKITIKDEFFKDRDISLTKATGKGFKDSFGKTGGTRTYADFKKTKDNDGIYTLTVKATDLAGNIKTLNKTFIVNRFGSKFKVVKKPSDYGKEPDSDVLIRETNISGIKEHKCIVSRDATEFKAKDIKTKKNGNDTTYTIPKSNFDKEGVYKVYVESLDNTGNTSKSKTDFSFTIDQTPPVITYTGIESRKTYSSSSVRVNVSAIDSLSKDVSIKVASDGKNINVKKDENGSYAEIGKGYNQNIVITAVDKAGNSASTTIEKVSVSTNKLSFFVTHKPLTIALGLLSFLLLGLVAAILLLAAKKKQKDTGDDITL